MITIAMGEIQQGDGRNDLVFDIDIIAEGGCDAEGRCQFWVAPATLPFQHVTNLGIRIDWSRNEFQVPIHEVSIAYITRGQIENQKIRLDPVFHR